MKLFKPNETTIEDYLAGRLSVQETEEFELWLADHPEQLTHVQNELTIKLAVDEIYSAVDVPKKPKVNLKGFLPGIKEKLFYALTGAVACALTMILLWHVYQPAQVESNIPIITLSHTRAVDQQGFSPSATIELSGDDARIVLVSQLVEVNDDLYNVSIRDNETNKTVLKVENLKPFGLGDLHVAIPVFYLQSGDYWLDVKQKTKLIDSLPFSVTYQ